MRVRIFSGTHRCRIEAGAYNSVAVDGSADIGEIDGWLTVDNARGLLDVRVPEGTDLVVGSSTGRIDIGGRMGAVSVTSDTGRVTIESAVSVDARTETSRIDVGSVEGSCRIHTQSGRVEIDRCGTADVAAETSRIELDAVHGPVRAHTVSGRIHVAMAVAADVEAETVTGRVDVSLPKGTVVHRPVTGAGHDRPGDADCTVVARSTTGRVEVSTG